MPRSFSFLVLALCGALVPAKADSVLVLPFFNAGSKAAGVDWIGESISETIRESLHARGMIVLDREDQQEAYRRLSIRPDAWLTRASVLKVGEALDAATVVFGDFELVREDGATANRGRLRVTGHLLDMKRLMQTPEFTASGPLDDLDRLQMLIAWQAVRAIEPDGAPTEQEFASEHPRVRLDAMENYIRGLMATDPAVKHRLFTQAVRLADDFAQPSFELGKLYWAKKEYATAAAWFGKLKPGWAHYMEANFLTGLCRYYTADYEGAQKSLQMVAQEVPLNEVFNDLGAAQSRTNQPQALENFRKALEGDEADPDYHFNVGYVLWKQGDFAAAADRFRAVLDRNPEDAQATLMLGRCLKKSGPRPGDPQAAGLERLKHSFEERAYNELKAALQRKRPQR